MALRWGIAGSGKISHDFVNSLGSAAQGDHEVIGVAARDLKRAQEFASLHKIPNSYQGYEPLTKNANIDIVYIGVLNPQHYEVAKMMLENGKHVLCEKPLCLNYKESKSLTDLAKEKKLFLMEAVWSRFLPVYDFLNNYIKEGHLGEIHQVHVEFGVPICNVERVSTKELGGGTVLDLGIYVLQFAQMIYGCEPKQVVAAGHLNEEGVDLSMSCVMTYPQGGTATLSTHSKLQLSNEAVITGTKGTAKVTSFWCATKMQLADGSWKEFPLPKGAKHDFNFTNSENLRYEADECRRCIKSGLTESPRMSLNESLILAKLEDTVRKQIGVHFSQDN